MALFRCFLFKILIFWIALFGRSKAAASGLRSVSIQKEGVKNLHFLVERGRRQLYGKIKVERVGDDMACIQQCSRLLEDGCMAVNYKKEMLDGLHDCELLRLTQEDIDHDMAFENNNGFDYFIVKNLSFQDCGEIMKTTSSPSSGVYKIKPFPDLPSMDVMCDMTTNGGGWTVIQNRQDGSVNFYRGWDDYKRGFGNKEGEYWLGLDTIHKMTSLKPYKLRIDLEDFTGQTRYAEYDTFAVAGEDDKYRLTVGQYSGNVGDSLTYHNNKPFTTLDRDNDDYAEKNCADSFHGGWWYRSCHYTNLNGLYLEGGRHTKYVVWKHFVDHNHSLKRASMKIRLKDF